MSSGLLSHLGSYLLRALDHFLINEWHRKHAVKRGGGTTTFSLDSVSANARYRLEPADGATPETLYDQRWAATVLEIVRARLGEEYARQGRADLFTALMPRLTRSDELLPYHSEGMAPQAAYSISWGMYHVIYRVIAGDVFEII